MVAILDITHNEMSRVLSGDNTTSSVPETPN